MFLKRSKSSLVSRLTLWYSVIFAVSSLLAFGMVYILVADILNTLAVNDLQEDMEELSLLLSQEGPDALWAEIEKEVASEGNNQEFYRLLDNRGNLLRSTDMTFWSELPPSLLQTRYNPQLLAMSTQHMKLDAYDYEIQVAFANLDDEHIMQIGLSLEEEAVFLKVIRNVFMSTVPLLILVASAVGWFLARKALGGVEQITRTATEISHGKFDERVPYSDHGEEINRLAETFNTMLDKIQLLIRGMREITDNVAHDLRSPLTRIRGEAEAALTGTEIQSMVEYQQVLGNTIEESDHLLNMINTMLDITETEAGLMPRNVDAINVSTLVHDAFDLFQPLAANNKIDFTCEIEADIRLEGNASFLQRLIANLIDNALKYTEPGGYVSISLMKVRDRAMIEVKDTGIGITEEEKPKIFNRFFRADSSRSKPGNGLGLCLAQAIAKAHWGEIQVDSSDAGGSVFTVVLPIPSTLPSRN